MLVSTLFFIHTLPCRYWWYNYWKWWSWSCFDAKFWCRWQLSRSLSTSKFVKHRSVFTVLCHWQRRSLHNVTKCFLPIYLLNAMRNMKSILFIFLKVKLKNYNDFHNNVANWNCHHCFDGRNWIRFIFMKDWVAK